MNQSQMSTGGASSARDTRGRSNGATATDGGNHSSLPAATSIAFLDEKSLEEYVKQRMEQHDRSQGLETRRREVLTHHDRTAVQGIREFNEELDRKNTELLIKLNEQGAHFLKEIEDERNVTAGAVSDKHETKANHKVTAEQLTVELEKRKSAEGTLEARNDEIVALRRRLDVYEAVDENIRIWKEESNNHLKSRIDIQNMLEAGSERLVREHAEMREKESNVKKESSELKKRLETEKETLFLVTQSKRDLEEIIQCKDVEYTLAQDKLQNVTRELDTLKSEFENLQQSYQKEQQHRR